MVGSSSCGNGDSNNSMGGGDNGDGNGSNDVVLGGGGPFRSNSIVRQPHRRGSGDTPAPPRAPGEHLEHSRPQAHCPHQPSCSVHDLSSLNAVRPRYAGPARRGKLWNACLCSVRSRTRPPRSARIGNKHPNRVCEERVQGWASPPLPSSVTQASLLVRLWEAQLANLGSDIADRTGQHHQSSSSSFQRRFVQ
jgi:hypothetical protein